MLPGKPQILIVDDIKANSSLLVRKLSDEYECRTAACGKDALTAVHENRPDLILLDILMPEMDGFELCRRLKNNELTQQIPIIFITSLDDDEDEETGLALGAVDYLRKPFRMPIVRARIRNNIELKRALDLLEEQAFIDSLTTIPNRRRFDEVLEREWQWAIRTRTPLSLILMDIDFFKKYNDNYGHQPGDDCLRKVGRALQGSMKRGTDFVARYGGEEFAAILPNTGSQGALIVADCIREALSILAIPHAYSAVAPHVTLSQGVATVTPDRQQRPEQIIQAADKALYCAKKSGRNMVKTIS